MIVVEESTDSLVALNLGIWIRRRWWPLQQSVTKSLMVSFPMVMLDVLVDDCA
jgi:hypothetical protein